MNLFRNNRGSVAPIAVLFAMLSLLYTLAYLSKATTQSRLEHYRYAKTRARLAAEAGLNKVAMEELPYVKSDTALVDAYTQVPFAPDDKEIPLGYYKDITVNITIDRSTQRQTYNAKAVGVAEIKNRDGEIIMVEDTAYTSYVPTGFEEFMYFTDKEESSGPPNSDLNGNVNFGSGDSLFGRVHTNGTMSLSNFGCPEFLGTVTLGDINGGINYGSCDQSVFENDQGESIIDTVPNIVFPPTNTLEIIKNEATKIIEADTKIFMSGPKRDTLIMTEIEFKEFGYEYKQWWYLIPPVSEPVVYAYDWDDVSPDMDVMTGGIHLYVSGDSAGAVHYNPNPPEDPIGYGTPNMIIISDINGDGDNLFNILDGLPPGSNIQIQSTVMPKSMTFTLNAGFSIGGDHHAFGISNFTYSSPLNMGFLHNESVELILLDENGGLAADVQFNEFKYFHDHPDEPNSYCRPDGFHHFDFPGYFDPVTYEVTPPTFIQMTKDFEVIYIKGGQVLVKGVVDGRYTIVTDDFVEYRRSDDPTRIDRVWGNIWLLDDIVYIDSYPSGRVVMGTPNVLGLVAGGNIIIANTLANGARNRAFGQDIKINAAMIAMNEAFLTHYWQNTVLSTQCPNCGNPNEGNPYNSLGDGRGRFRNPFTDQNSPVPPPNTGNQDYRGTITLWGSVVQQKRGYVKRNNPGPYTSGDIGYDKYYRYDDNLLESPPPHFPTVETNSGATFLTLKSYGKKFEE